jgi:putative ATPase
MPQRKYYHPVPRGLELKIGEKLAEMARRNKQQQQRKKDNDHD